MKRTAEAQRLHELRAEAAAELNKPVDDDGVVMLSAHRYSRERLLAQLVDGTGDPERISEKLMAVGEAIRELSLSTPPKVELVIVAKKEVQECPQCGCKFAVQKGRESLEERQRKAP